MAAPRKEAAPVAEAPVVMAEAAPPQASPVIPTAKPPASRQQRPPARNFGTGLRSRDISGSSGPPGCGGSGTCGCRLRAKLQAAAGDADSRLRRPLPRGPARRSCRDRSRLHLWRPPLGIKLGLHTSEYNAQRALVQTALMESDALGDALRKVNRRPTGFEASFVGMTEDGAKLACRRIAARSKPCELVGP